MKEVILSPDNPPREGDVFVHNGFKLERFDPESRTWQFGVAYVHEAFMYGLTVLRPVEKVTGEPVAIIAINPTGDYVYVKPISGGEPDMATAWKLRQMGFKDGDEFYLIKKEDN